MTIKNYTTQISAEKTIMELEKVLAKSGATHIIKQYDGDGNACSIGFKLLVNEDLVMFQLPMRLKNVLKILNKSNIPTRLKCNEQAYRVGWRIIKDWVLSQTALIEIELAKPEEIFLPYLYDEKTDLTLFQQVEKRGHKFLLSSK
jgi:hypothetical protein